MGRVGGRAGGEELSRFLEKEVQGAILVCGVFRSASGMMTTPPFSGGCESHPTFAISSSHTSLICCARDSGCVCGRRGVVFVGIFMCYKVS